MKLKRRKLIAILCVALLVAILSILWRVQYSRSTLWRIESANCIPAAQTGVTGRCAEVSLSKGTDAGFVVFKDRNGPLQYLLMPTRRVTGIEDPYLMTTESPSYWADAWHAKRWMDKANGKPVPRESVSITVNSAWGRSQNQLHFHISCVRPDLRSFLNSVPASKSGTWTPIPNGWMGHPYDVKWLAADTLDGQDFFKDIAKKYESEMGRQAVAVIAGRIDGRNGFWLLRTHVVLFMMWFGAIESDVQDHSCSEAQRPA